LVNATTSTLHDGQKGMARASFTTDRPHPTTTNWIWLAEIERRDDVLIRGDCAPQIREALGLHFHRVHCLDDDDVTVAAASERFDCVNLNPTTGRAWHVSALHRASAELAASRHALRKGGCLVLPVQIGSSLTIGRWYHYGIASRLRRAGFRDVRPYYLTPSHDYFAALIPATRRATAGMEVWSTGTDLFGRFRWLMAFLGAHPFLYRGLLVLAYP
jgi:hypothetical protein